jgi:hypothetical protein
MSTRRFRQDVLARAVALMQAEYTEMPGLVLTPEQAQRLLGLDDDTCAVALATLTTRRFLKQTPSGAYLRERSG